MIKLGTQTMLLQDPNSELDRFLAAYLPTDLMQHVAPSPDVLSQRGLNTVFPNYPDLPCPRLNQIVIPTGATRWSYGLLLANNTAMEKIYQEQKSAQNRLELIMTTDDSVTESDDVNNINLQNTLRLTVSALPPKPVVSRSVAERFPEFESPGNVTEDLWIIPVVDARYWWQFIKFGASPPESIFEIISTISGLVSETIIECGIHPDYNAIPDLFNNSGESFAIVFESICWHMGWSLVPDLSRKSRDPITEAISNLTKTRFAVVNDPASRIIYDYNMLGRGGLVQSDRTGNPDVGLFGYVHHGGAAVIAGDRFEDYGPSVPYQVVAEVGTATHTKSADASGHGPADGYDADPDTIATLRLAYTDVSPITTEHGERVAADHYGRLRRHYDVNLAGVHIWQPEMTTDCVVYRRTLIDGKYQCSTRVRSNPLNFGISLSSHFGGTGGGGGTSGGGCSCECVGDSDLVVDGIPTVSKWGFDLLVEMPVTGGSLVLNDNDQYGEPATGDGFVIEWNATNLRWELDVTDYITGYYEDGTEAPESAVTITASIIHFTRDVAGWTEFVVDIDGSVDPPPPPP